jgi:hypothetical protein
MTAVRSTLAFLFALAEGLAPAETRAAAKAPAYVETLVAAARQRHLATTIGWLRLGHYRSSLFGGYESEADGKPFFIAKEGKDDPGQELSATLRAFFSPVSPDPDIDHGICRFPARFLWLNRKLHFDPRLLPRPNCSKFREFLTLLKPDSITLVFSSYYLNNPSSAFGHTFLRVNKRTRPGANHNDLLDYGVDYSAQVDVSNAVVYAIKGIAGLFPGMFRKVPYYLKVREYNDYESRDLWEYDLALEPREVEMFAAHLWELGSTYFAYYYLSENCSYHVLGALEAASPRLQLLDRLRWPVLPADTVKALYRNPGLVREVHYRPSAETVFKSRVRDLTSEETEALARLVSDANYVLPRHFTPEERVRVLDAALDLVDSKYARDLLKDVKDRDVDVALYKQRLLERRSEEAAASEDFGFAPPFRRMPHLGHGSRRFALGSGRSTDEGYFHTMKFRFALHDIGDPARGFPETAQVEFLPTTLRYYAETPKLTLEDVSLVTLLSLSPWDTFRKPLSWSASIGATRIRDRGCTSCLAGQAEVGGGFSLSMFDYGALLYFLGDVQIMGLAPIDGGIGHLPLRAGAGPSGGLRLRFTDDLLAVAQGRFLYLPAQTPKYTWSADATVRWQYVKDFALGVEGRVQPSAASVQAISYIYF